MGMIFDELQPMPGMRRPTAREIADAANWKKSVMYGQGEPLSPREQAAESSAGWQQAAGWTPEMMREAAAADPLRGMLARKDMSDPRMQQALTAASFGPAGLTDKQQRAMDFITSLEKAEKAGDRNAYTQLSRKLFGSDWQGHYRNVPGTVYDMARKAVLDKGGKYILDRFGEHSGPSPVMRSKDGTPYSYETVKEMLDARFRKEGDFPRVSDVLGSDWGFGTNFHGKPELYRRAVYERAMAMYNDVTGLGY